MCPLIFAVTIKVIAKVRTDLDILVDKIENICTKRQVESAVGLYDVDLLEMRLDRGKSVVLWLWCRTKDSLDNLRKLHEDNYLHKSISTVLQGLIKSDGIIVHVDSKQFQKDYSRCILIILVLNYRIFHTNVFSYVRISAGVKNAEINLKRTNNFI